MRIPTSPKGVKANCIAVKIPESKKLLIIFKDFFELGDSNRYQTVAILISESEWILVYLQVRK
jgi:hypothetical protein